VLTSPTRVKIIADAGINFNGDLDILKALALVAKNSGCDYIKIQKREPDWAYSSEELKKPCESPWGKTVGDKVRGRELDWIKVREFSDYCTSISLPWSSSCFDLCSLRELHRQYPDRPFNKIASAMALQKDFVTEVAEQRIPTLISAALCTDAQLDGIVGIFERTHCVYVVNHCIGLYPCPPHRLNLMAVRLLAKKYHANRFCAGVGYSGHETGVLPSVVAALLGATWIERHITLDRSMYGADQAASLEPTGIERLARDIRSIDQILGTGQRILMGDEKRPVGYWRTE
jgi:N-acetylneuraminate synthase